MTIIWNDEVKRNMSKPRKLETYFPITKNEGEIKAYLALKEEFDVEVWVYPLAETFAFNAGEDDLRGNYPTWYDAMIEGIKYLHIEYKGEYKDNE